MKRVLILLLLAGVLLPTSLLACDTNLIALISGSSSADAFVEKSSRLVELSVKLGKNYESAQSAIPVIKEIMNAWISFDNNFSQFPPEWARKDQDWKNKLKMLADIIGEIKSLTDAGEIKKAHDLVLVFSKKLTFLYEKMPKSDMGQILYNHSIDLIELNEFFAAKNSESFSKTLKKVIADHEKLTDLIGEGMKKAVAPMGVYLRELNETLKDNEGKLDFKVKMRLMTAEDAFVKMNEELKKPGDRKESKE